jgi:PrtD family type I secretion system ABC transporter
MNWMLSRPLRPFTLLAAGASLLLNLALVVPSLYMLQVFDRVFASRSVETLVMLGLFAVLALGLAFCMDRGRCLLLARAGRCVDEALAAPALTAALTASARGQGDLAASALPDIARLRSFLASPAVHAMFDAPWLPVYLAVIFLLHPLLGWAALGAAVALFALGVCSDRLLRADTATATDGSRAAAQRIDAMTRNAEVLVGMHMLGNAVGTWGAEHRALQQTQDRLARTGATLAATGRTLRQWVQVAMLALGAWLVVAGHASPGIMIAATLLVGRALQPVEQLIAGWRSLVEVRGAWQRLQQQPVAAPDATALELPALRGALSLERVGLRAAPAAPGAAQVASGSAQRPPLVWGVSLAIDPGTCLGVVGPSGSGKTTLLRLMLGLRQPDVGSVRLDGVELAQWPAGQLDGAIGYLPQDVELFAGTVAQNIARLGPIDSQKVMAAAQLAGIHEMVARLPQAYDTELGEGGAVLSGGQRQRIALARAVYGNPKLVVLDEPNASLDADGEEALGAAIAALKQAGTTLVLVSHRPALMRHADTLAVLRDGALDLIGPRDAVLSRLGKHSVVPLRRHPGGSASDIATNAINAQGAHA